MPDLEKIPAPAPGTDEAKDVVLGRREKEGRTPGSQAQLAAASDTIAALLPGLRSYRSTADEVDADRPAKSLAQYAQDYAKLREELDASIADGKIDPELAARTVAMADELAIRQAMNPSSRIRPAYDRRQSADQGRADADARPRSSTVSVQVGQSSFRVGNPWAEVKDNPAEKLYVRVFHAKMDFLQWRIANDLIAVDDTDVSVDLVLSVRTGPVELTGPGKDIKLPPEVDRVHFYVQPEERHRAAAQYAMRGHHTEWRPPLDAGGRDD